MKKFIFFSAPHVDGIFANLGLLIGRLGFGLTMAFGHGLGKLPPSDNFVGFIGSLGFPAPTAFAWFAGLSEFGGGLFLALGFITRLSSSALAFTMFIAAFLAHGNDPFKKMEMALIYFFAYLLFSLVGPGRYSIDKLINK